VGKLELEEELEKLGLAEDRQDLCDRLEARNALRERQVEGVGRLEHIGGG
jgi:hypothetical protein